MLNPVAIKNGVCPHSCCSSALPNTLLERADHQYLWHSVGTGPNWSFLETEILRKIGEMVKKLKKKIFLISVC